MRYKCVLKLLRRWALDTSLFLWIRLDSFADNPSGSRSECNVGVNDRYPTIWRTAKCLQNNIAKIYKARNVLSGKILLVLTAIVPILNWQVLVTFGEIILVLADFNLVRTTLRVHKYTPGIISTKYNKHMIGNGYVANTNIFTTKICQTIVYTNSK